MSKLNILRNVVVISLSDTSLWTGRAKMTAEDLGLSDEQVPPDAIASLGSKRVIDGDALKPLNKIRYLMRRACLEVGTRFLGGFAVAIEVGIQDALNDNSRHVEHVDDRHRRVPVGIPSLTGNDSDRARTGKSQ